MLKILIIKEIQETINTFRFLITTLLCLILIPLGIYVSLKDYEYRLADYKREMQLYQERSEGKIGLRFRAEGYRPPSPLSVFSCGLKDILPSKVVSSRDDFFSGNVQFKIESKLKNQNPQSSLFGKVDFAFIVSFVLSILALIFTFSSITSEKEKGTFRLIISNSVPRWKVILSKISGNYLVFLAPFMISLLLGLLILNLSGIFPLFSREIFPAFLTILTITLLFMFTIFNLGILISTLTHNSITSMITLLFVWVIFTLGIPKISPMIAQIIYPIKSQEVIETEKQMVRQNLEKELQKKEEELFKKILSEHGIHIDSGYSGSFGVAIAPAKAPYDEAKIPLQQEYNQRINTETAKIENQYKNKQKIQTAIAVNLSRISPMSCFTYILSELSGTGMIEMNNFHESAKRFQGKVKKEIYDNYIYEKYAIKNRWNSGYHRADGFDPKKVPIPHLTNYQNTTLEQALQVIWIDIVLLCLFSILFFAAAFVSFLKYDVR